MFLIEGILAIIYAIGYAIYTVIVVWVVLPILCWIYDTIFGILGFFFH